MLLFAVAHAVRLNDGSFAIRSPEFPGCEARNPHVELAREQFGEALRARLLEMLEAGEVPPLHTYEELGPSFAGRCTLQIPAPDRSKACARLRRAGHTPEHRTRQRYGIPPRQKTKAAEGWIPRRDSLSSPLGWRDAIATWADPFFRKPGRFRSGHGPERAGCCRDDARVPQLGRFADESTAAVLVLIDLRTEMPIESSRSRGEPRRKRCVRLRPACWHCRWDWRPRPRARLSRPAPKTLRCRPRTPPPSGAPTIRTRSEHPASSRSTRPAAPASGSSISRSTISCATRRSC